MVLNFDAQKEKTFIQGLKNGERSAFDELVEIYKNKGFAVAFNMVGNFEDAKDVLQESFIKVYLNIRGFKEESSFSTWFYRIIVNCALDLLRKRKKISHILVESVPGEEGREEIQIPDNRFEPTRVAMANEFNRDLDDCIANLSEKQRICFVLKHQNGLNIQEISQILRCNPSTVKVHIFRAIRNLREGLSKYLVP